MSVQRGFGSIIAAIIGIVILAVTVVIIVKVMTGEPPIKAIIYKTSELRRATAPLERANLITDLDDLVVEANNDDVKEQWDRMTQCLAAGCPDEAYLDMILVTVAAFEQDIPESALLINIIATAKYWDKPENLLDFSKALSIANEQIQSLDNRKIEKIWTQIVECNGVCPEKNSLYFELIGAIVQ